MRPSFSLLTVFPKVRQLARDLCGTTSFADERALAEAFVKHNRDVRTYFGDRIGTDLLVLDIGAADTWDRLCGFLGHKTPNIPFPHCNRGYGTTLMNMKDLVSHAWPLI
jgi:hypothetical protein